MALRKKSAAPFFYAKNHWEGTDVKINAEIRTGSLHLALEGELDHHSAEGTLREIESLLDRYLPRNCILDFSRLTFMDSSGIALLLRIHKRMQETESSVWVENPAPQPRRVLDAAGINRIVRVKIVEGEAVR